MLCDNQSQVNNQKDEFSKYNGSWVPVKIKITDSSGILIEDSLINLSKIEEYIVITNNKSINKFSAFDSCMRIQTIVTAESGDSLFPFDNNMDTNNIYIFNDDTLVTSSWFFGYYTIIYLCKYNKKLPPQYWPSLECKSHPCIKNKTCDELKNEIEDVYERYNNYNVSNVDVPISIKIEEITKLHNEITVLSECYQMVCQ